jgi:drug/metabolite transporter (DMT)-like permease
VRKLASTDDPFTIYLAPCLFGLALFFVVPFPTDLRAAGLAGPLLLFGIAFGSFLGQALMAYGYREVSAGSGSIVFYWETALTIALGALVAGEHMNLRFFIGLALILAGLRLNQIRGRLRAANPRTVPIWRRRR